VTIASLTDVHNVLNIPTTDTNNDTELTYWLTPAEAVLVQWLKAFGGTLNSDQSLVFAEAALAAWFFRKARGPSTPPAGAYLDMAKESFNVYKSGTLMYPKDPGLTPMESTSSDQTTGGTGGAAGSGVP